MKKFLSTLCALLLCSSLNPARAQVAIESWVKRHNGGHDDDKARALAVDANGNVFVTGYARESPNRPDFATIKYSSTGQGIWTNFFGGPEDYFSDEATALVLDPSGNVIVTGVMGNNTGDSDFATVKYSNSGVPIWTNIYVADGNDDDRPTAIGVDSSGNVYVTGQVGNDAGGEDCVTIKYSSSGTALWTNFLSGPGNTENEPCGLAVDAGGNVYVTGTAEVNAGEYFTIKYSTAGAALWTNRFGLAFDTVAKAIALDANGNAFVTGTAYHEYATIKYASDGTGLWTNLFSGPGGPQDSATALGVDTNGDVYVTGYSDSENTNEDSLDYVTIKYSGDGVALWTNRYDRGYYDQPRAIAVRNGMVCVTGVALNDYTTLLYTSSGQAVWTNHYNFDDSSDLPNAVAIDQNGNVYVTGESYSGSDYDYATVKYSSIPEQPIPLNLRTVMAFPFPILGNRIELSWTNAAFHLQSASQPAGPYTNVVDGAESPYVTDTYLNSQKFYRLKAN